MNRKRYKIERNDEFPTEKNRPSFNAKWQVGQRGSRCLPTRHAELGKKPCLIEPKITMKWGFFCV